ncbi:MAG: hypothetical protein ACLRRB_09215 [Ruminococcus sp.]
MVYYTGYEEATRNTAGGKAPADIKKLCEKRGYSFVKILMPSPNLPAILQKYGSIILRKSTGKTCATH